jgi:hypothetical protein
MQESKSLLAFRRALANFIQVYRKSLVAMLLVMNMA